MTTIKRITSKPTIKIYFIITVLKKSLSALLMSAATHCDVATDGSTKTID